VCANFKLLNHQFVFVIDEIRFYDKTGLILRHKISIPTIKRFLFYDIKFALYRSNVCIMSL